MPVLVLAASTSTRIIFFYFSRACAYACAYACACACVGSENQAYEGSTSRLYNQQYIATLLFYCHQIRVKLFEARQLIGGNIHPVVRVSVADQDKDSKIKKCTNNPAFNEVSYLEISLFLLGLT